MIADTPDPTAAADPAEAQRAARLARLAARGRASAAPPSPPAAAAAGGPPPVPPVGTAPPRRRHPARSARAAALGLSVATTAGLTAAFAAATQVGGAAALALPAPTAAANTTAADTTAANTTAANTTAANTTAADTTAAGTTAAGTTGTGSATTAVPAKPLASGTYTGAASTNRWGTVQVRVTVSNGSISDVTALSVPTGGKSDSINARAVPVLRSEALAAQSSSIAVVSGATYTSASYKQSLQSALDQAAAAAAKATPTAG